MYFQQMVGSFGTVGPPGTRRNRQHIPFMLAAA